MMWLPIHLKPFKRKPAPAQLQHCNCFGGKGALDTWLMPPSRGFLGMLDWYETQGTGPDHIGRITYLSWLGFTMRSLRRSKGGTAKEKDI